MEKSWRARSVELIFRPRASSGEGAHRMSKEHVIGVYWHDGRAGML